MRWSHFLRFLVGCELRLLFELRLSLEVLAFLLPTAGKFASSMAITDALLDQPEEFLASQM